MLASNGRKGLALCHFVIASRLHLTVLALAGRRIVHVLLETIATTILTTGATQTSGLSRLGIVGALAEEVGIACDVLVAEVEHQRWVQGYTTKTGLEVQVRTSAATSVAAQTDRIASAHLLVLGNQMFRHVTVDGLQSVSVANDHVFAIALRLIAYDTHLTGKCSTDGVANVHLDIQSFVLTAPTGTEIRGDDAAVGWHAEVSQVDAERVGQLCCLMGIAVVPIVVEVGCGRLVNFVVEHALQCY